MTDSRATDGPTVGSRRTGGRMSLWRLELLRLVRTRRALAIVGVYVFFGLTGPLTARYLNAILSRVGTTEGARIELPPPGPADGIAQFVSNASQLGLLVVVLVAASALAFDARLEMAAFLRTRVDSIASIVGPAFTVNAAAAAGGFVLGSLAAWYETAVLIGPPATGAMLAGTGYGALFLVFAVAVVAAVAASVRGVLGTAGISLGILLVLALVGNLGSLGRWLPTNLAGAMVALLRGGAGPAGPLPAAGITVVLVGGLLWYAVRVGTRREL